MAASSVSPRRSRGKRGDTRTTPDKPYRDFPLTAHPNGRWVKKHRGRQWSFGPWADWRGALERYQAEWDYIVLHGKRPPANPEGTTVADAANAFLTSKKRLREAGEITQRTFDDYYATCGRIVTAFGKQRLVEHLTAEDFGKLRNQLAKRRAPVTLTNEMTRIRSVFKAAYDDGLIDRPVRYGQQFNRPSRKTVRKARQAKPEKLFSADEVRKLLAATEGKPMHAAILLGINCAMGNQDIADMELRHLDLDAGWLTYPRGKTGVLRRCPLWPETVEAVRAVLGKRTEPKAEADRGVVFITKYGRRWVRQDTSTNAITGEFNKALNGLGIKRAGVCYYSLRHTHRTVADEVGDRFAADVVMGHEPSNDIATHYVERVSDDRLLRVSEHVRAWLFGKEGAA